MPFKPLSRHILAVKKTTAAVFHGRPDPLPDAVNSPQAAGTGRHRGALPVPSVREGVLLCPVLSWVTACVLWPRFRAMLSISSLPTRHISSVFVTDRG